jgi:hypothetical protein
MKKEPKKKRKKAAFSVKEAKKLAGNCISCHGGHIEEIPLPIIRFFESDKRRKRTVSVTIGIFAGIGIHYHVDMKEENDGVLDRSIDLPYHNKPVWRECWDDQEAKGMMFWEKFNSVADAARYVKKIWKKEFSAKTHKLRVRNRDLVKRLRKLGMPAKHSYYV